MDGKEKGYQKSVKNHCLNVCKAIAACFVVFIHCNLPSPAGGMMNGLARFAVPLFFLVSGYFIYERDEAVILRRAGKIGLLFLGSNAVYFLWKLPALPQRGALVRLLLWNKSPFAPHLWFLGALLYCYFFYFLLVRKGWEQRVYWLIPLCLGLNLLLGDVLRMAGIEIKVAYVRNFWLTGLPFFLWGHWFRNRQERGRFAPPGTRRGTILCVLAIGAGAVSSMAEMLLSGGAELYLGSVLMAGGIFVLALTHPQAGAEGFISHVGEKVSLHIYLWQMLVLDVTEGAALFLGIRETAAYAWLMPFFVCAASWMLGEVLSWLGVVIKNRKEKQL